MLKKDSQETGIKSAMYLDNQHVEWRISDKPVAYQDAVAFMETRVQQIYQGTALECVWLLEHPPLFTAGTSAKPEDMLETANFPVHMTGRGGQYTYHGPGQRVIYVMLDLRKRGQDVRAFIRALENWIIQTLDQFNIRGLIREDRVGIWIERQHKNEGAEDKIAAIGVRLRRWISYHGVSLNIHPDLEHYQGIVPCGLKNYGVTSFEDLGYPIMMSEVDMVLQRVFRDVFG